MNLTMLFTRIFFTIITIVLFTVYAVAHPDGSKFWNVFTGVLAGGLFSAALFGIDTVFKRFNLRSFNIVVLGLFFGYLMGMALLIIVEAVFKISTLDDRLHFTITEIVRMSIFIFGLYLGTIMTLRAADEIYISIPFVKFAQQVQKKKDIIVDSSVLSDSRILDLCSTGILDNHMIIPRFIIKEMYSMMEQGNENQKARGKRALDNIQKLKALPALELRFNDTDFPELKDPTSKIIRLARLVDANVITADVSKVQISSIEGVKVINIHSLSSALKPIMEAGEQIKIKIQRYGKEPQQGVGYLEDGTMVVVNGGGNFIGETIDAHVLSVKHTASGRMIFCNAIDGEYSSDFDERAYDDEDDV